MTAHFSMKRLLLLLALCASSAAAEKGLKQENFFTAPRSTAAGILFSDQLTNGLFLATNSGIALLSNMPGSSLYYTVSPDGYFIGFNACYDPRIRNLECSNDGFFDIRRHSGARRVTLNEKIKEYTRIHMVL